MNVAGKCQKELEVEIQYVPDHSRCLPGIRRSVRIGKILIQRDEETHQPKVTCSLATYLLGY